MILLQTRSQFLSMNDSDAMEPDSDYQDDDSDSDFVTVDRVGRHSRPSREEDMAEAEHAAKRKRTTDVSRGVLQWSQMCWDAGTTEIDNLKETYGIYKCSIQKTFEYSKGVMRR